MQRMLCPEPTSRMNTVTIFLPLLQETKARQKQNKLAKWAVIFIDINLGRKPSIHRKIEHNQLPNRK